MSNYIAHHGVKGMKWGVRKEYEPRPRQSSGIKSSTVVANGKKYVESKHKGLTDKQKKAIKIGATVVATGLAIYGGYKLHNFVGRYNVKGIKDDLEKLLPDTPEGYNIFSNVNPTRSKSNCGAVGGSMALIKNGITATAKAERINPYEVVKAFKGATASSLEDKNLRIGKTPEETFANITKALESYGDGHYGILWGNGKGSDSGHNVFWEIENGKAHLYEGQRGGFEYNNDTFSYVDLVLSSLNRSTITFSDLSGKEVDLDRASKWADIK